MGPYSSVTAIVNTLDRQRQSSPLQVSQGDPRGKLGSQKDWFVVSLRCLTHLCKFRYFELLFTRVTSQQPQSQSLASTHLKGVGLRDREEESRSIWEDWNHTKEVSRNRK